MSVTSQTRLRQPGEGLRTARQSLLPAQRFKYISQSTSQSRTHHALTLQMLPASALELHLGNRPFHNISLKWGQLHPIQADRQVP